MVNSESSFLPLFLLHSSGEAMKQKVPESAWRWKSGTVVHQQLGTSVAGRTESEHLNHLLSLQWHPAALQYNVNATEESGSCQPFQPHLSLLFQLLITVIAPCTHTQSHWFYPLPLPRSGNNAKHLPLFSLLETLCLSLQFPSLSSSLWAKLYLLREFSTTDLP